MRMAASQTGPIAFGQAGVTHNDIDLCTIYDSFTITVLMTLENLSTRTEVLNHFLGNVP